MDFVLVHIGEDLPDYIVSNLDSLSSLGFDVHFVCNKTNIPHITNTVKCTDIESFDLPSTGYRVNKTGNINHDEFLTKTSLRFFVLSEYAKRNNLENFFHIENDVFILDRDCIIKTSRFLIESDFHTSLVMDCDYRCVPSILWFRSSQKSSDLWDFVSKENRKTDMELLSDYFDANKDCVINFPISPPGYKKDDLSIDYSSFFNKVDFKTMVLEVWENIKSVFIPIMILFLVGALAGTWLISGIIPAMVYYGLQVLNPAIFLPASVVIAAVISVATGSSWTTSATVGIALVGIGTALGIPSGMIAGAVISGAYFGDKMSPLSDTTNLAPAMAGTDIFTHIRYMTLTTVPTILITILVFTIISLNIETTGSADVSGLLHTINETFHISLYLFIVPLIVIVLILLKTKPLIALGIGVVLAAIFAIIFQGDILDMLPGSNSYKTVINSIFVDTEIVTDNEKLNKLFSSGGMKGMLWTIYLILCAMVFGGIMDAIGALARITNSLLKIATSVFGLFASTVISCVGLNAIASDQYLAIVIPGKNFKIATSLDNDL